MTTETMVVFGGSSGIGEATAKAAKEAGMKVVVVGRDPKRLEEARARLGDVTAIAADGGDRKAVEAVFAQVGAVDHVVIAASGGKGAGAFVDLDLDDLRTAFAAKVLVQFNVAQVAAKKIRANGSITLIGAASTRSRIKGTVGLAAVNAAIETAVPVLAHELAPLRVNAVSPGIVDTEWWNAMPVETKKALFSQAEKDLPVRRVGTPDEVAKVVLLLAQSGFVTGSIYEIDGGSHLTTQ